MPELTAAWRTKITLHSFLLRVNSLTNFTVFCFSSWPKRNGRSTLRIIHCRKASFIRARTTDYLQNLVPGVGNLPSSCWLREAKKLSNQYRLVLFLIATQNLKVRSYSWRLHIHWTQNLKVLSWNWLEASSLRTSSHSIQRCYTSKQGRKIINSPTQGQRLWTTTMTIKAKYIQGSNSSTYNSEVTNKLPYILLNALTICLRGEIHDRSCKM